MTPDSQFFREMVEPTVAEFMADKSDLRRGLLACLMVAHVTEHVASSRSRINAAVTA